MNIENLTIRQLIDMMVSEPSKNKALEEVWAWHLNPDTLIQFYFLKGYNLEGMELESVIYINDGDLKVPRIEITVKGVGTDEGGNDSDDDVGASVL